MSLHEGAITGVGVDYKLFEEFDGKVGMHQGSVLSLFRFAVVADGVTELAREDVKSKLVYADDLVLMSEKLLGLRIHTMPEGFLSKGLKVNPVKANVMVSDNVTNNGMCKSKVNPCLVCSLRVKANSLLSVQCGKWIHGRCIGVEMLTTKFKEILLAVNVKGRLKNQWSGNKRYVMK